MVQMNDAVSGVADLLSAAAREHPDKVALVEVDGRARTWAELADEAGRLAHGLGAAGLVAGYRVVLAMGNRIEFVATYLGVLQAQLVAVPVNPRSTPDELERVLTDCGARMVVADAATVSAVRTAVSGIEGPVRPRVVVVGTTLQPGERSYDHLVATAGRPLPGLRDPESLAALL